jgi:broad specificity phosphatase PhoE
VWLLHRTFSPCSLESGQTDENIAKPRILQGQSQTPLNVMGHIQAAALGWRLKDLDIHEIYTSNLMRAQQVSKGS